MRGRLATATAVVTLWRGGGQERGSAAEDGGKAQMLEAECFWYNSAERCVVPVPPSVEVGSSRRWPRLLGLGAAKSGTTVTARMLEMTGQYIIGDGKLADHQSCCFGETSFFVKETLWSQGLEGYAKCFPRVKTNGIVGYYEKAPIYSFVTLVPFLARAYLSPDLKIIFSIRDTFDNDVSQYVFFKLPQQNTTYPAWVKSRVQSHAAFESCRARRFAAFVDAASEPTQIHRLYDPASFDSLARVNQIEDHLQIACEGGQTGAADGDVEGPFRLHFRGLHLRQLRTLIVTDVVERWSRVFPRPEQWLCYTNEELVTDPAGAKRKIFDHAGVRDGLRVEEETPRQVDTNRSVGRLLTRTRDLVALGINLHREGSVLEDPTDAEIIQVLLDAKRRLLDYVATRVRCAALDRFAHICGFTPSYDPYRRCIPDADLAAQGA
mmetsp:Transcript_9870/g.31699  ORF Transcript_9870/g.31699 Transcript_9870/m.31699 type:complete len:436 (-) Transcript_9870:130-1437(-)